MIPILTSVPQRPENPRRPSPSPSPSPPSHRNGAASHAPLRKPRRRLVVRPGDERLLLLPGRSDVGQPRYQRSFHYLPRVLSFQASPALGHNLTTSVSQRSFGQTPLHLRIAEPRRLFSIQEPPTLRDATNRFHQMNALDMLILQVFSFHAIGPLSRRIPSRHNRLTTPATLPVS